MQYVIVNSVREAVEALAKAEGKGRIIAGGTDIVLEILEEKITPEVLVDVTRIPELQTITIQEDNLVIGAAANLTDISLHEAVLRHVPSLAKAASRIGSRQIGNVGTLVGNVVTGQPAADGAMALGSLDPSFRVVSPEGQRTVAMKDMYAGFGKSTIDSSREIIVSVHIPLLQDDEAAEFIRLDLRESLSLPMLNASAAAKIENGTFSWVRIAMGPVGVGPTRAEKAEQWLRGKEVSADNIHKAARMVLENANPRSNLLRGSREYRLQTLPVIVERALTSIANQLGYRR